MRKILVCTQFFYPDKTGTGKVLGELFSYLADKNYVTVLSSRQSYNDKSNTVLRSEELANNTEIKRVFSSFADKNKPLGRIYNYLAFFTLATAKTLITGMHKNKDILVSVSNPPIMPLLPAVLKLKNQKFLYILHDLYPDLPIKMGVTRPTSIMSRVMFAVNKYVFNKADKIVVLGRDMRDYLHNNYNVSYAKLEIITNWASAKKLEQMTASKNKFKIIYSGNIGRFHNLEMLITLAKQCNFVEMKFIGEGAQKLLLMDMAQRLNLSNVTFSNYLDDDEYIQEMSTANAFAVSLEKNLTGIAVPSKFYTYLSMSRPIICIAECTCEMAMVIEENKCGLVVAHEDTQNLCHLVEQLHLNKQLQYEMGKAAQGVFIRSYEQSIVMKQFERLFANL